jgi:hypothetical protein
MLTGNFAEWLAVGELLDKHTVPHTLPGRFVSEMSGEKASDAGRT